MDQSGETGAAGNRSAAPPARNAAGISLEQLSSAVERGIITPEQRAALLGLGVSPADPERQPGFSVVHLLYYAGAGAVLFALGWFLIDRWKSLHPAGVLAVSLLYATAFTLSSMLLSRIRFRVAASLFALLAVGMAPIAAWCIESLTGLWPPSTVRGASPFTTDLIASVRWIPIELSAALAALIALRRVRFSLLALAVAVPFGLTLVHLTPLVFDPELDFWIWGWVAILAATALVAAGYLVEQRTGREPEDYARFVYLTAAGFLVVGVISVADQSRVIPHSLPLLVALLAAVGVALRRLLFIGVSGAFFVGYLGFLAGDVFKTALAFMVVIVAAGALLLLGTVFVQHRFPGLLQRKMDAARQRRPTLPYARIVLPGAMAVALALLFISVGRADTLRRERAERQLQMMRQAAEARHARAAAQQARQREQARIETPARARP